MAFNYLYNGGYQPYMPQAQTAPPAQMPGMAQSQVQAGFAVRPVTSKAEAVAAQIPFDGSTSYFVDTSSDCIYAKTFNFNDGTAPIVTYVRKTEQAVQYATLEDLQALKDELTKKGKAVKKDDE